MRYARSHRKPVKLRVFGVLAVGSVLAGLMSSVSAPQASADTGTTGFSFAPTNLALPAF